MSEGTGDEGVSRVTPDTVQSIDTPSGAGRLHIYRSSSIARACLVLGHGAGAGTSDGPMSRDLDELARLLPGSGIDVVVFEQPWRVAGKRVATHPNQLDRAWVRAIEVLRAEGYGSRTLVLGGRSSGARVACRTAQSLRPDGVLALSFPLHRPGLPEASRHGELVAAARVAPVLVIQGARDAFGGPDEVALALLEEGVSLDVVSVAWAGHTFSVPAKAPAETQDALDVLAAASREFVLRLSG